uniref:Natural cytotoxicity triggering receptor 1 n=3 Tax=Canis lupus TaxID=9612 RepID=A0A8C0RB12_CANLF
MTSTLTALLFLGEFLHTGETEFGKILSKPIIWVKPNFMIPKGMPVLIWCQGTPEAIEYQLHLEGHLYAQQSPKQLERRNTVMFRIPKMTLLTAGQYRCFYRIKELWSKPSDPLDLVVTGMYDTPTLSVHPGNKVISGKNVTFSCRLDTATNKFFLLKEGRSSHPQHRYGNIQVEFPIGPVTTAHRGTYRCFGSYNNHAWSFPSKPVKLLVTETNTISFSPYFTSLSSAEPWDTYLLATEAEFQQAPAFWDHTAHNILQIGLAFLVLMALMCLLVDYWLCRKRIQEQANRASPQECRRRFRTQRTPGQMTKRCAGHS